MKSKLNICLLTSSFLPNIGGAEIGLHNICLQLLKKGHNPIVMTSFSHFKNLKKQNFLLPYKVISFPPLIFRIMSKFPNIAQLFLEKFYDLVQKKYNFDFWHTTFAYPTGVSVIKYCNKRNINYLVRAVGEDIQINKKINYGIRLNKQINDQICEWLPKAKIIISISNSINKEYLNLGVKKEKIINIPNGIDLERITNFSRKKKTNKQNSKITFLSVGRYHRKKNFESLLDASNQLSKKTKNFVVNIVGTNVNKLLPIVERMKLKQFINLYEPTLPSLISCHSKKFPTDEILKFYKDSNVFIMPSILESFGIVTVEAMGFGLPIIIAKSPGNIDVVRNGKDAFLYDGTISSLEKAMLKFINNKKIREFYSRKSKRRSKDFNWSKIVDHYVSLYRD